MELPVIGVVGIQGLILGAILLASVAWGYFAGLNRMLSPLLVALIALCLAVIPQFHGLVSENISLVFAKKSRYAAYLIIFVVTYLLGRFTFSRLPRFINLGLSRQSDGLLGILAGLVYGFIICTMFLILIYGWHIPVDGLYTHSKIGTFICKVWAKTSVLPELSSVLYRNPLNLV